MAQHKRTRKNDIDESGASVRIPADVLKAMKAIAKQETRTIAGQITVALREYLMRHNVANGTQTPGILPSSVPAQRHPELTAGKIPLNTAKAIVESDEGWEGTPGAKMNKPGTVQVKI